jgi:hypothetical protein
MDKYAANKLNELQSPTGSFIYYIMEYTVYSLVSHGVYRDYRLDLLWNSGTYVIYITRLSKKHEDRRA